MVQKYRRTRPMEHQLATSQRVRRSWLRAQEPLQLLSIAGRMAAIALERRQALRILTKCGTVLRSLSGHALARRVGTLFGVRHTLSSIDTYDRVSGV